MLTSMTGFGRAETAWASSGRVTVEARSVNHRFLEVEARLPEGLQAFEDATRTLVVRQVRRGQIRVSVALKWTMTQPPVVFQADLAERYLRQLRQLQRRLKLAGPIPLETVLTLPQVMAADRAYSAAPPWPLIERAVTKAVAEMVRMRKREGARLEKELRRLVRVLGQWTAQVRRRVPEFEKQAQKRLADRMEAALESVGAPESKSRQALLAEAASWVQSTDVSEELARIDSHHEALLKAIAGLPGSTPALGRLDKETGSSPGRTMDFLAQELQREVNTLGTKMRDPAVLHAVVAMKGQIEKLREQAANVE